jgi:hypothetical protein
MSWVSPNWVLHILLICHSILDWILDVVGVFAQGLVVALLGKPSDLEWAECWWVRLNRKFSSEAQFSAVSFSQRIKSSMLGHRGNVGLILVKDEGRPSLVVELPHVLLSLVGVLNILPSGLKSLIGGLGQEVYWNLLRTFLRDVILLHVHEFGVSRKFSIAARLK